jgi:hypothetical protein
VMGKSASAWVAIVRTTMLSGAAFVCALLALTLGCQKAEAIAPPAVYTGEALDLTTSSATLVGSIYPGDEQTTYYFEYGLTSAYGQQSPTTTVAAGTQGVHVSEPITGLTVDTTYHYRLVATNPSGTVDGQQRVFTTKKIPLTFTLAATPQQDLFGNPFSVTGTLAGTGSANHQVVLQANPFPYLAGFKAIGTPELTSADGSFSFSVPALSRNSELRVATLEAPPVNSQAIVELVPVRVTLHVGPTARQGFVRLYGTITPGEFGAIVGFELLRPGHRPRGVASTVVTDANKSSSRFSRVVRIRLPGLYRALVYVENGAQATNHSRSLLIR